MNEPANRSQGFAIPGYLIFIFFFLTVGFIVLGYLYYQRAIIQEKQIVQNELSALADLKVQQILNWRQERSEDVSFVFDSPLLGRYFEELIRNPSHPTLGTEIQKWMDSRRNNYRYKTIFFLSPAGEIVASSPTGEEEVGKYTVDLFHETLKDRRIVFSDLYRFDTTRIYLDILSPLFSSMDPTAKPIGVLVYRLDPSDFLYPLIQNWPLPNRTSETLLIRKEKEEVVYLNELRHRKNTALKLRFPLTQTHLPSVMAIQGKERNVEGTDYRGTPVLASLRKIPNSPWYLVAKMDLDEIYGPVREHAIQAILITILLILTSAGILGFIWRDRRAFYYRKLYEAEIQQRALVQHFEYLTRYANDIIFLFDDKGKIVEANERAVEIYGYSREELLQLNEGNLGSPEWHVTTAQELRQVEEQDGVVYESLHRRKDGSTFLVEISSRVIEIEGKKFYQAIIRDIHERKRTEEMLRKLSRAVEYSPSSIVITDTQGRIEYVNPKYTQVTGYQLEEVAGKNPGILKSGHTPPEEYKKLWETILAGNEWTGEFHNKKKNGELFWELASISPIKDPAGKITHFIEVKEDITEKKELQEVAKRMEELATLGQFSASIAHEIRNPLAAIRLNVEMLSETAPIPEEFRQYITDTFTGVERIQNIIRDILNFARPVPPTLKPFPIHEVIETSLHSVEKELEAAHIKVIRDFDSVPGAVQIDPNQITEVFINLFTNARQAMKSGGELTIRTRMLDHGASVEVEDTGVGISDQNLDKIFSPFFTTKPRGMGLGLAVVYRILENHHAKIFVDSTEGGGSCFRIEFLTP